MAHDIHDAFFQATFSQPEHAAGELRHLLPAKLSARIDFDALTLIPGSFIDEALSRQYSDLLFSVPLSGRPALIYVLFEHKSSPEALTAFQLLRYMVEAWQGFLRKNPQARRLPAIVPVVVHHGEDGWTCAPSFEALLDVDDDTLADLGAYVVRFRFFLDDLNTETDDALRGRAMTAVARLALWCLRHARSPKQIVDGIGRWLDLLSEVRRAPNGMAALATIWRYVYLIADKFGPDDLMDRLIAAVGEDAKEEIVTAGEQLIERGRIQGHKEGHKDGLLEGRKEGQQRTLLRLLRARFGPLTEATLARVHTAGTAELDLWAERIITAPTLEDVLRPA